MPNVPVELSLNDIPIQQMSTTTTTVRCRRKSSFSVIKCNNNRNNVVGENEKNRQSTTFLQLLQEYQEEVEGKLVKDNGLPLETLLCELQQIKGELQQTNSKLQRTNSELQQTKGELQQTKALVVELESKLTTEQMIAGELPSENESESHTTAVEIDQESDDDEIDIDHEFHLSSPLTHKANQDDTLDVQEITPPNPSSGSSVIPHSDESFDRICSALQNLINDGQVALQKPNSSSPSPSPYHQSLELPQRTTRPRSRSWSSSVSNWIMNHYNPSPMVCECGSCWLCLETSYSSLSSTTTTARTTPKSSRTNSISSVRNSSFSSGKRQVQLARIKRQYRKKLEGRSDYRKSCEDLEVELQKLVTTAISTGVEHGLMNSPTYHHRFRDEHVGDSSARRDDDDYFGDHYYDEEMSHQSYNENGNEKFSRFPSSFSKAFEIFGKHEQFRALEKEILDGEDDEERSSEWRRRILNCLQKIGAKFNKCNNDDDGDNVHHDENVGKDEEDNEKNWYGSYNSSNSSWGSPLRGDQENSNGEDDDPPNPFPSSFINTLNLGRNIFNFNNFNVNLVYSKTHNKKTTNHYFNETNNYYNNYNTTINNSEEKSPQLSFTRESKKSQSPTLRYVNLLAMMGFTFSISQAIVSYSTSPTSPTVMSIAARNLTRTLIRGRARRDNMIVMIKVIKYISVLFVGWAAGRIGKKEKGSSNESNRTNNLK